MYIFKEIQHLMILLLTDYKKESYADYLEIK